MIRVDAIAALPAAPGAYALLLALPRAVAAPERLGDAPLGPGLYVYAGSARGPGGIRARVARHARRGKPRHWHVDRLTEAGRVTAAVAIPEGRECAIVETLRNRPGVGFPARFRRQRLPRLPGSPVARAGPLRGRGFGARHGAVGPL